MRAKCSWRSRSMTPIFNTSWEIPNMPIWCKFGDSSWNPLQLIMQTKFSRIPSQNGQNDLEGQGQWPPFSIPAESTSGGMFGANLVILAQICNELSCGQLNFLEFWVKMTLKLKVNDLHFQYQPRISRDVCLVQIWWFQVKSVTSYHADKVKFTDGQTQATTRPLWPFSAWKAKGLVVRRSC